MAMNKPVENNPVLITVYTHSIKGRDIQIRFTEDIFLDEQPEMIGKAIIDAWKVMAEDRPAAKKEKKKPSQSVGRH